MFFEWVIHIDCIIKRNELVTQTKLKEMTVYTLYMLTSAWNSVASNLTAFVCPDRDAQKKEMTVYTLYMFIHDYSVSVCDVFVVYSDRS